MPAAVVHDGLECFAVHQEPVPKLPGSTSCGHTLHYCSRTFTSAQNYMHLSEASGDLSDNVQTHTIAELVAVFVERARGRAAADHDARPLLVAAETHTAVDNVMRKVRIRVPRLGLV